MNNRIVTFHILLAAQFALVAANIIMNIKIGLFSMIFILLLTTTCLIQLNNDEQTNWKPGRNIMTYLFVAWLLFYFRCMEYQHHPIYTHRPDMCLYSSDNHSYQKRHRTATDRMVCIRHHIYNQRILAEKPWFQLQGPSFFIFNGRCPNPYHLVGHPLFLLLYRCGKLRRTLRYGNRRFHH
mgnify:CR=1 FL=1